ncbi:MULTISPECIES: IreB family regulatory phosphoprotein [Lawsonibacter]|uniref:IreB family regulatory phosphoprotein n=1 Tax=Lawsonibacter TaxID=2172004 RepID=UPI00258E7E75|nr:IreB family regulatory phosphoprotein [Lawsonibacter sp.]MCI6399715.1 IreB family regulatory phosphoprotein [Lawsonibacter sp.]MDY2977721.1 IreB family regulatory phosphoprotein [Oscillospiraceae bacterium]
MDTPIESIFAHIVASIQAAGYDPYAQLYGYLKTGNESFITRTGDARNIIKQFSREKVQHYTEKLLK